MPAGKQGTGNRLQLTGWILFSGCSVLFIVDSALTGSPWGLAGSIAFLLGCILFIISFTWKKV